MQGKIFAVLISLGMLGLASYETLRLAVADHYYRANTLASLERAAELDPGNSQTWLWLAEHQAYAGADSSAALETAARLSRYDSAPVIRLALRAELLGARDRAEQLLLEAARVDHLYEPRWSLANFYFRSGAAAKFWPEVTSALEMAYGDQTPLYRLCWRFTDDPAVILSHLPERRSVLAGYLAFLLANKHVEDAAPAARRFAELAEPDDVPLVLAFLDQSLDLVTWNTLCQRGLVPYPALDPARGPVLTNPDFRVAPLLHGFDWRVTSTADIAPARISPPGLRITFSGSEPESCELLSQPVPVRPGGRYRFRFDYESSDIPAPSGLHWSIAGAATADLARSSSLEFTAHAPVEKLALTYSRVAGATRIEGAILLRNLAIEPQ